MNTRLDKSIRRYNNVRTTRLEASLNLAAWGKMTAAMYGTAPPDHERAESGSARFIEAYHTIPYHVVIILVEIFQSNKYPR
jgi:hypothetical protein